MSMDPSHLTTALKDEAVRLGFDLAGATPAVAPAGIGRFRQWLADGYAGEMDYLAARAGAYDHPQHVLPGAKGLVMLAVNYRTEEPAAAEPGFANVSRFAWGTDYHELIRGRLHDLADFHRRLVPEASVRGVVDTAPLLEREFAQKAGLGWIGKNTMLINRQFGSWVFLAALLTDQQLTYDEPTVEDPCGSCSECLRACPTGALIEPYRLDARRCRSYLTIELRGPIPVEVRRPMDACLFGCDACQQACPHNRETPRTAEPELRPAPEMNPIDAVELFSLDEDAFRRRFRHSSLWRTHRQGLLRNAAITLGNRPVPAALPALTAGLQDPDPIVRTACAWALGQYPPETARSVLRAHMEVETDTQVRQEIQAALAGG